MRNQVPKMLLVIIEDQFEQILWLFETCCLIIVMLNLLLVALYISGVNLAEIIVNSSELLEESI